MDKNKVIESKYNFTTYTEAADYFHTMPVEDISYYMECIKDENPLFSAKMNPNSSQLQVYFKFIPNVSKTNTENATICNRISEIGDTIDNELSGSERNAMLHNCAEYKVYTYDKFVRFLNNVFNFKYWNDKEYDFIVNDLIPFKLKDYQMVNPYYQYNYGNTLIDTWNEWLSHAYTNDYYNAGNKLRIFDLLTARTLSKNNLLDRIFNRVTGKNINDYENNMTNKIDDSISKALVDVKRDNYISDSVKGILKMGFYTEENIIPLIEEAFIGKEATSIRNISFDINEEYKLFLHTILKLDEKISYYIDKTGHEYNIFQSKNDNYIIAEAMLADGNSIFVGVEITPMTTRTTRIIIFPKAPSDKFQYRWTYEYVLW